MGTPFFQSIGQEPLLTMRMPSRALIRSATECKESQWHIIQ
jgi:hypothetical protein